MIGFTITIDSLGLCDHEIARTALSEIREWCEERGLYFGAVVSEEERLHQARVQDEP
jgi:hypothetical protein